MQLGSGTFFPKSSSSGLEVNFLLWTTGEHFKIRGTPQVSVQKFRIINSASYLA